MLFNMSYICVIISCCYYEHCIHVDNVVILMFIVLMYLRYILDNTLIISIILKYLLRLFTSLTINQNRGNTNINTKVYFHIKNHVTETVFYKLQIQRNEIYIGFLMAFEMHIFIQKNLKKNEIFFMFETVHLLIL